MLAELLLRLVAWVALRGRIDQLLERLGRQQGRLRELSARLIHRDASVSAAWERLQQRVEARRLAVAALERRYQERCADLDQLRQARRALV